MIASVVSLESVSVRFGDRTVIDSVSWTIRNDERWVVLGPNGSGKSTLLKMVGAQLHPTSGSACVLGGRLGRVDMREVRKNIGVVSGAVIRALRPNILVGDVVLAGRRSALETWWDTYDDEDRRISLRSLEDLGVAHLVDQAFNVISEGERQKVLLARALVNAPGLLLLDEPFAGLDLGARERLLVLLQGLFADSATPPVVLVTHHAEEIPPGITHALLLREGCVVASGPVGETLTSVNVSTAFDVTVSVSSPAPGRFAAQVR